jgi:hypothetical protein
VKDWDDMPEAAGAVSEPRPGARAPGWERFPESSGPVTDVQAVAAGWREPRPGAIPLPMDHETLWRERDAAERRNRLRQRVHEAALALTGSALEAQRITEQALADAGDAARKAAST